MHHFDLKFSKFWEKMNSFMYIYWDAFFSFFFSNVKNVYWLHQNALRLRMHLLMQISQNFPGEDPHLREGVTPSPTLPLSALRASVKPSIWLHWSLVPPPRQWRFGIRPWRPPFYYAAIYIEVLKHKTQTPQRFTMLLFILYALLHIRISAL